MRGATNAVSKPGLLGQKGFSRSGGFFDACGGILQDGFDLAAPNAGEPLQKFVHRDSVFQVFNQSADGSSRSPKNTRPTDLVGTLLNALALEPEVHRNTIPREGSSLSKIPSLADFAGGVKSALMISHDTRSSPRRQLIRGLTGSPANRGPVEALADTAVSPQSFRVGTSYYFWGFIVAAFARREYERCLDK